MRYEEALAVQHRHEKQLMALDGVNAVGIKLRGGRLVLEVSIDPDIEIPKCLRVGELDGLPLEVERRRYEPQ